MGFYDTSTRWCYIVSPGLGLVACDLCCRPKLTLYLTLVVRNSSQIEFVLHDWNLKHTGWFFFNTDVELLLQKEWYHNLDEVC